jgi:ribosomal 30S subunit maturation factor RimM
VASDLVTIGRVGKPHGLDGSFFVEGASERAGAFADGTSVHVVGEPSKIAA